MRDIYHLHHLAIGSVFSLHGKGVGRKLACQVLYLDADAATACAHTLSRAFTSLGSSP